MREENVPVRPSIQWNSNPHFKPYFDPISNQQNITATMGKSTFLICNIRQITDESVSFKSNFFVPLHASAFKILDSQFKNFKGKF